MTEVLSTNLNDSKRKKPLIKRWWVWGLLTIVCLFIFGIISSLGSEEYELSQLKTMNKQEVILQIGKPDESGIIRDEEDNYYYMYPTGLTIYGNKEGVTEITLMNGDIEEKGNVDYTILGVGLDSSFDKTVKTMGKANLSGASDGRKSAMYHEPKEDFILNLLTEANSDRIIGIRYVQYESSDEAEVLNLLNLVGNVVPEEKLKNDLDIHTSVPYENEVSYYFASSTMENWIKSSSKDGPIFEVALSSSKFYNIGGLRIGDSYEKAEKIFGSPVESADGIDGVKLYSFDYQSDNNYKLEVSVGDGKIGFLKATLKSEDESVLVPSEDTDTVEDELVPVPVEITETVPQDMWSTLDDYQKTEFNQYFSHFSAVGFFTNPYIKDSEIKHYSDDELIKFAIAYNIENFDDRYGIDSDDDEYLSISDTYISDSIKQLFNIDISHKSVSGYDYKKGKYLWSSYRWAKVYANTFSQVETLTNNGDETYTAEISIFTDSSYYGPDDSSSPNNLAWYEPKESSWSDDSQYSYIGSAKATFKDGDLGGFILTHYEVTSM